MNDVQLLTVIVVKVLLCDLHLADTDSNKILVVDCETVTLQTVDIVSCC